MPERGRVAWFSGEKGFGALRTTDGKEVLVHFTEIAGDGFRSLQEGSEVEFEVVNDERGREWASEVTVVG